MKWMWALLSSRLTENAVKCYFIHNVPREEMSITFVSSMQVGKAAE